MRIDRRLRDAGEADLSLMLENLVIPRLIAQNGGLARSGSEAAAPLTATKGRPAISASDVARLTEMSVNEDANRLLSFVERFLMTGHSVETIFVELLAPSARLLGEYWEEDREDFVTVTMALWRIQEVLRELTLRVPPVQRPGSGQRTALFSTLPGEQHSLGTMMIAECFERAGWRADVLIEPQRPELTGKFASCHYDLVGLTISCDCSSGSLADLITTIRTVSRNPRVKVLIGGHAVNRQPAMVIGSGADGTAVDAVSAMKLAESLVPLMLETPDHRA